MTSETVIIASIEKLDQESLELTVKYENPYVHGNQILKCLDAMRKERQLCDIILSVEGHEVFAHRALLLCHSNYFLDLFLRDENDHSMKKQVYYQIDGLEHNAVKLIIQFIYQGSFQLTAEMVPKVYLAAHQLRVETIFKACSNYLAQQLNENNCLSIRLMAVDDDLRDRATECIQKNFLPILETREFHQLPSIKLEIVDYVMTHLQHMCELVLYWVIQRLQRDHHTIQELSEYTYLLYLNDDQTLHDCADMDEKNNYFCDAIQDYQSYKLQKRNYSNSDHEGLIFEKPNLQLMTNNLPVNDINQSSIDETQCIHIEPSTEHSYIVIAIINGKMLSITIHLSTLPSSIPSTPDQGDVFVSENHQVIMEKDMPLATLAIARCGFGIASTADTIFALGGYDRGDCLDSIEQFNPIENQWTLLAIPMTTRRGRVSAAIVQNKIYVCGGSDGQQELDTGEVFDLQSMNKWTTIKDLPKPVAHGAMCSDDSFLYLIGGCEGDKCKKDCYRYDPQRNNWTPLNPMNNQRSQSAAVYFDGKIYVFGGYTANRCLSSCEFLHLSNNEWFIVPPMRENRRGCGAIVYEKKIFVIGGSNGITSLTSIEIFDPISNEWIGNINQELNIPRVGLGIATCQEKLYTVGGFDGRTFLKSSEVYDQIDQRWKLNTNKTEKINNQN